MEKFRLLSPIYFIYLAVTFGIVAIFHFLFAGRSRRAKLIFLYIIAGLNVFQHLFKAIVWPHLAGTGFTISNTMYNVCATMILLTPFFLRKTKGVWRESIALIGTIGSMLALVVPFWFIGKSILQWEFLRFYTCHLLLFITSILPITWRMVEFKFTDFWKIGLCFLGVLGIILFNDIVCICVGIYGSGIKSLAASLYKLNPFCMMRPLSEFTFLERFVRPFTPSIFMGSNGHGYTPILWYCFPLYMVITLIAVPVMRLLEKRSCNF